MTQGPVAPDLRTLCLRLYAAASAGDEEEWLSCFASGATIRWPGLARPTTGHRELRDVLCALRAAIPVFELQVLDVEVVDSRARVTWSGGGVSWDGRPIRLEGVDDLEAGADGLINTLHSHWAPVETLESTTRRAQRSVRLDGTSVPTRGTPKGSSAGERW